MSADRTLVRVTAEPLSVDEALAFLADPGAGGTCLFVGTVRDVSDGGQAVTALAYESWEELAVERLAELGDDMHGRWALRKVALLHRTGRLGVGEASVVVGAAAAHRAEAFEACRHGIEQLKHDIPIWKKESFAGGEAEWVMGA